MTNPIVTLLTDFGMGGYAAQMKGVLLGIVPHVRIVDLTHSIPAQNIVTGSMVLADSAPMFPPGTIHVAVVDPGVGTQRPLVVAEIGDWKFIGPDNGLLSVVAESWPVKQVIELKNSAYWRPCVSKTFHGRDIMAPVAGHVLKGVSLESFGPIRDHLSPSLIPPPICQERLVQGLTVAQDSFGNLITNIRWDDLEGFDLDSMKIRLPDHGTLLPWFQTYGQGVPGQCAALLGSSGRLEIAVVNGSAANLFPTTATRVELTC